jgi:protein gp37
MNKQGAKGIEWTRVYGRPGYTWNPIQGCVHDCKWVMPDGTVAGCYAKAVAEKFRSPKFMPDGFEKHYFNPHKLPEPLKLKTPAGIFMDSMSDFWASNVPPDQRHKVLDVIDKAKQHIFFSLTKNAPAMAHWQEKGRFYADFTYPKNLWLGASVPPSEMHGGKLELHQQMKMLHKTMKVLAQHRAAVL